MIILIIKDSIQPLKNQNKQMKLHTAVPTDSTDRTEEFKVFSNIYLQQVKMFDCFDF